MDCQPSASPASLAHWTRMTRRKHWECGPGEKVLLALASVARTSPGTSIQSALRTDLAWTLYEAPSVANQLTVIARSDKATVRIRGAGVTTLPRAIQSARNFLNWGASRCFASMLSP